jgi:hypothetical protein
LGCDQRFFPDTVRTMTTADEQVFVNGKICTEREEEEFAGAFKVSGGRFYWFGDAEDVASADAVGKNPLCSYASPPDSPGRIVMQGQHM